MGLDDYKADKLSAEIRKNDLEMMEKARIKREAEEAAKPKELGRWELKIMSSTEYTPEDLQRFLNKLVEFESSSNGEFPMLRIHIDPILE